MHISVALNWAEGLASILLGRAETEKWVSSRLVYRELVLLLSKGDVMSPE